MKQTLATRSLFTLSGSGFDLRGTCHLPQAWSGEQEFHELTAGRLGVVIVNSLGNPRSGSADSAVSWAEAFARGGYPCFRVDLPGLGDSRGDLPAELLPFITEGGYSSLISLKLKELVDCFALEGVILMGHCAGAVTAIHAASEQKACKGLILIDPYFNNPRRIPRSLPSATVLSRHGTAWKVLRDTYDAAGQVRRALSRDRLPGDANRPLLRKWKGVAGSGLPILILGSPWLKTRPGQFDWLAHALKVAGRKAEISVELLSETDHSFATASARDAVRRQTELWLSRTMSAQNKGIQEAAFRQLQSATI